MAFPVLIFWLYIGQKSESRVTARNCHLGANIILAITPHNKTGPSAASQSKHKQIKCEKMKYKF